MGSYLHRLNDLFAAVAFAEAGEFDTARAIADGTARRRVLLALRDGGQDGRVLATAQGLCQRLDADLDILVRAEAGAAPEALERFLAAVQGAGLRYRLTRRPGLRRRDLVAYANRQAAIAALVIDSLEAWEAVAEDRGGDPWRRLGCPLVTAVGSQGTPRPAAGSRTPVALPGRRVPVV